MIVKDHEIPINCLSYEYVLTRIPGNHPQVSKIEEKLGTHLSGYHGEASIQFHLQYLSDHHHTLYNLRLFDGVAHFQIDILLLFPTFALILEVKNRSGHLVFDRKAKQWTQIKEDGSRKGDHCPVEQAERQARLLNKWMKEHASVNLPVYPLVVLSNSKCTLEFTVPEPRVIRAHSLFDTIQTIKPKGKSVTKKQLFQLAHTLKDAHEELIPNVMKQFGLRSSDLIDGVGCPECGRYYMVRQGYNWFCRHCKHLSRTAHERSLVEYAYLISPWLTVNQAMLFLKIESRHVVRRLLLKSAVSRSGAGKGMRYYLR
ncbi:nuclease-related domain-containing protein [Halobacillus salinus]|uniref:nuclease-related domain-containing protein n=1 Tax=Halobacillus salinus TaxID=192814 RepID=UPI001590ECC1|nr:nuclease-related domain-containing protein [Halobacillus salinus]